MAPSAEVQALKTKMAHSMDDIRRKNSTLTVQDMKRLLFRCAAMLISLNEVGGCNLRYTPFANVPLKCERDLLHYIVFLPFEVSTPPAMSAGIEVWTWVNAERPEIEVALMTEVLAAWSDTIKQEKGIFSTSLKSVYSIMLTDACSSWMDISYDDPFYHPIDYSPTDKEVIDRATANACRLLTPHALVLQMLFSRLQAARYRRPGVMFLIQNLVLRSARAYKSLRSVPPLLRL
jgi:phosphatidylinositol 4-kinase